MLAQVGSDGEGEREHGNVRQDERALRSHRLRVVVTGLSPMLNTEPLDTPLYSAGPSPISSQDKTLAQLGKHGQRMNYQQPFKNKARTV